MYRPASSEREVLIKLRNTEQLFVLCVQYDHVLSRLCLNPNHHCVCVCGNPMGLVSFLHVDLFCLPRGSAEVPSHPSTFTKPPRFSRGAQGYSAQNTTERGRGKEEREKQMWIRSGVLDCVCRPHASILKVGLSQSLQLHTVPGSKETVFFWFGTEVAIQCWEFEAMWNFVFPLPGDLPNLHWPFFALLFWKRKIGRASCRERV